MADAERVENWLDLLSCARLCLTAPKRGGKKHNLSTLINAQIRSFHPNCWKEHTPINQPDHRGRKNDLNIGKIVANKIEAGDVKGAVRILSSDDSLAPNEDTTFNKLLAKHPPAPTDSRTPPPIGERHVPPMVTPKTVENLIGSFPAGSAGGPDRLCPQILKDLTAKSNGGSREIFLNTLTSFMNLVLSGKVPESIRPLFFSANLFALNKKCGGIRPIAVGNTLRRLASKCLGSSLREERQSNYGTVQLGYGTALGAEAAAHAARNYIANQKSKNHVLLKIDLENAFNSVRRDSILEATDCHVPSAFPYTLSAYGADSFLFFGKRRIVSALGAQQGDPEGPALFSDTINQIIQRVETELNLWYLDDGNLADSYERVLAAFKWLQEEFLKIGLKINPEKCELFFLSVETPEQQRKILAEFNAVCPGVKVTSFDELVILGAPIGAGAITKCLSTKTSELERMVKNIEKIDSHHAFFLLKNCFHMPKLLYFLRTAPCFQHSNLLDRFDDVLCDAIESLCNVSLTDFSRKQLSLPCSLGGLGLPSAAILAPSAFCASAGGCSSLVASILREQVVDNERELAVNAWLNLSGSETIPETFVQRKWSRPLYNELAISLKQQDGISVYDSRRLDCYSSKFGSAWLNAFPSKNLGLKLTDSQLRVAIALRLGCKICETHTCRCGKAVSEDGTHGLSCKRSAGRFNRHAQLNDLVRRTLSSANVPAVLEPPGLCREDGKRPDGLTLCPWNRGNSLVWDVTVIDSLAPSRLERNVHPLQEAERKKTRKYSSIIERGYIFQPVAFDTQGNCGPETESFLKELGVRLRQATFEDRASIFLNQRISIMIQQYNFSCVSGTLSEGLLLEDVFNLI